jgi:uncharacterized protein
VADPACIPMDVVASRGSTENVQRLRSDPGARLAMMQSDVYQAFLDEAAEGNAAAAELVAPLRVVMPMYLEEIYFVVRADEEALRKLIDDRSIDVVTIVAGQPATIFANMRPEARKYIRLLRLDPDSAASRATASTYVPSTIRASSYPAWMEHDVPTLSTRALLVTNSHQTDAAKQVLVRFAGSLCDNFHRLRSQGHAKWHEVRMALPPLGKGWRYYAPTRQTLMSCTTTRAKALVSAVPQPDRRAVRLTGGAGQH